MFAAALHESLQKDLYKPHSYPPQILTPSPWAAIAQKLKSVLLLVRANLLRRTFSLKYLDTKEPRMVVKMRLQLSSDISVMASMLKWRSSRLVMGLRPPPGGPMAATNWVSIICLKAHGGLLSYHPCRGLKV